MVNYGKLLMLSTAGVILLGTAEFVKYSWSSKFCHLQCATDSACTTSKAGLAHVDASCCQLCSQSMQSCLLGVYSRVKSMTLMQVKPANTVHKSVARLFKVTNVSSGGCFG